MSTPEAFNTLYRTHAPGVFRRARQLLRSEAEAHEVVQDLFLSLFERPAQFAEKSSITGFLYGATTHACLNRLRNQRNRKRLDDEVVAPMHAQYETHGADALSGLRDALARMPEPLGQLAVYYYYDEMTHEEIAQLLGCSRRQVGNLLERLHGWLREQEMS